jgi:glycosyltransferase involved in cell wall biosynthesis
MTSVLHVSQPTSAGVARVVLGLATDQRSRGVDVTVACPAGELADDLGRAGVPWQRWESARQPGPGLAAERRALGQIVTAVAPDVVHLHSSKAGLVGRMAVRGRIPTVFQPHAWSFQAAGGPTRRAAVAWERYATRWTGMTLYCSRREQQEGAEAGITGPGRVVLNGVDPGQFTVPGEDDRRAARRGLNLPVDAPVAVVLGRRSEQKGQDIAVAAWPAVRSAYPSAVLLLMGGGYEDGFDRASGVATFAARSDPRPAIAAADLMLSPSRWEGLSLALLEGMASGRPTVASDVAGSREALLDGPLPPAGAVIGTEDAGALAAAVLARLGGPDLARREASSARRRVESCFTEASTTRSVLEVYDLVLDEPRSSKG